MGGNGGRGRPRKSAKEKILEGSRARLSKELFKPTGAPFVPDHLNDDAQACMEHIIKHFDDKYISSLDSYALTIFASAWAWHKAAVHAMSDPDFEPIINRTLASGIEKDDINPWFRVMNEQARVMMSVAGRLYLTPADRQQLEPNHAVSKSKFDGLIGRKESSDSLSVLPSQVE